MFPHERLNSEGEGGAVEENLSTSGKETDHLDRDKNEKSKTSTMSCPKRRNKENQ